VSERTRLLRRRIDRIFLLTVVLYVALGLVAAAGAVAQQRSNPVFPEYGKPTATVPTGSDDKSVEDFYHYNQLRELIKVNETYVFDTETFLTYYGLIGIGLISFYFLTFSWYARLKTGDLYPTEVYNGYIAERGGPVDPFNWAVYAILLAYMLYYTFVMVTFGQQY
jgi:hypothetical protein